MLFFASCKKHRPDISKIKVDLKVERFEKDLFAADSATDVNELQNKYGEFFQFYFNDYRLWFTNPDSNNAWKDSVVAYTNDPLLRALYDSVEMKFSDLKNFEGELTTSLRYYKYYFPQQNIPAVITLINGPGRGAFTYGDSILCIALDDYMGKDFSYYRFQDIPQFVIRKFSAEYMLSNCMQVLITQQFDYNPSGKRLLDAMIANGKIMYMKSLLMPDAADSITTGFKAIDLKWLNENEKEIWKFFISKNLLYSQEPLEFMKFVTEGPGTSGMPPEAPGNVGSWVGWRIVVDYMGKHSEISLQQLMNENDAQKILTDSKYKP